MLLRIKVSTRASKNEIIKGPDDILHIKLIAPPRKGKANKELIKLLAKYFRVSKSSVRIKSGEKSKNKIIELDLP